jgi:hypothetical protein
MLFVQKTYISLNAKVICNSDNVIKHFSCFEYVINGT